jgi:hypothetical protein
MALALVEEWRSMHISDLEEVWSRILEREPYCEIPPLE